MPVTTAVKLDCRMAQTIIDEIHVKLALLREHRRICPGCNNDLMATLDIPEVSPSVTDGVRERIETAESSQVDRNPRAISFNAAVSCGNLGE